MEQALDWYIVSDHSEYLGALPLMEDPDSPGSQHPLAADITGDDAAASFAAYGTISDGMYSDPPEPDPIHSACREHGERGGRDLQQHHRGR